MKTKTIEQVSTPEERKRLAGEISRLIQDGVSEREALEPRWDVLASMYRGEPYQRAFQPYEGAASFNLPLIQPKVDGLCAHICNGITANRPYFLGTLDGQGSALLDEAEEAMQFALEAAKFSLKIRQAAVSATLYGRAVLRVSFETAGSECHAFEPERCLNTGSRAYSYAGLKIDAIEPRDFICTPAAVETITRAKCVGHRFMARGQEIRELQNLGEYYADFEIKDGQLEQTFELWNVLVKLDFDGDGVEERYEVVLVPSTGALLQFRHYSLSRPWYFSPFFRVEQGSFWHSGSIANNLQGLQAATNELWNLLYDGALMSAFPTQFVADGTMSEAAVRTRPGDVIPVIGAPNVQQVSARFDASTIPLLLQMMDSLAESVTRVPRTALGQEFRAGATATEIAALQMAASTGINEYSANFGDELAAFADFCWELIRLNYRLFVHVFGDAFPLKNPGILNSPIRWELNGKTPTNTPAMRYAMAERLLQLAAETQSPRIDVDALVGTMVEASELPNAQRVLRSDEEIAVLARWMTGNGQQGLTNIGASGSMAERNVEGDSVASDGAGGAGAALFGVGKPGAG